MGAGWGWIVETAEQPARRAHQFSRREAYGTAKLDALPGKVIVKTRVIGREHEIGEVIEHLMNNAPADPHGYGWRAQTRLAVAVGERVGDRFAGGVWLCEPGALADPLLVVQAVAAALGVREAGARAVLEVLIDTVGRRSVLLVLDKLRAPAGCLCRAVSGPAAARHRSPQAAGRGAFSQRWPRGSTSWSAS